VAVDVTDAQTGNRDIWIFDVASEVPSRFTFDAAQEVSPVWSPDGSRLLFSSDRGGGILNIYQRDSSRSANEELLLKSGNGMRPYDWSRTGRDLLYSVSDPKTGWDLWVLQNPTGAPPERKPAPYLQTPFNETQGQFSPDGHWIAYTSDESGVAQYQIYVQSFPAGAGKFQISVGAGGTQPRWQRDGRELFYIAADGKLVAVEVKTAPKFEAGAPKALFDPRMATAGVVNLPFRYDVAADGKRFLVNTVANGTESSAAAPITVVMNWQAAVRR
jgi:Tol biopolymer transport system component